MRCKSLCLVLSCLFIPATSPPPSRYINFTHTFSDGLYTPANRWSHEGNAILWSERILLFGIGKGVLARKDDFRGVWDSSIHDERSSCLWETERVVALLATTL
jgi:hypothetical protein